MRVLRACLVASIMAVLWLTTTGLGGLSRSGGGSNPGIQYPWRFAILSDTHTDWGFGTCEGIKNTTPLRACVDSLNELNVDFAVLNGDWGGGHVFGEGNVLHQEDIDSLYAALINRVEFPIFPVLGNHEAHRDDTTNAVNPYAQAIARFPQYFAGQNYYATDWKNVRFVALNTNVNYDVAASTDYIINNPAGYAATGGVAGKDYNGLHSAAGPQRSWLASTLASRNDSHWLLIGGHRGIFGSSANNLARRNYNASRSGRFMKQVTDSLGTGERALVFQGDQHLPLWFTKAIADSSIASSTGKGAYYLTLASGSGARPADSTETFAGTGLLAFVYHDTVGADRNRGRTSAGWLESMTAANDLGLRCQFTWALATVYADHIMIETFRTWTTASAGATGYTGAQNHKLVDRRTLTRDAG